MGPGKAKASIRAETVHGFRCPACGFTLDESNGGFLYIKNESGMRVPLKDKDERDALARILLNNEFSFCTDDVNLSQETIDILEERVGYMSACLCMDCLGQFGLDLRKDTIECPRCKSDQIKTFLAMLYKPCPRCRSGLMENMR